MKLKTTLRKQAKRWGVDTRAGELSPLTDIEVAFALLKELPPEFAVSDKEDALTVDAMLTWLAGDDWQADIGGKTIHSGPFEECVTALASKCRPEPAALRQEK